MMQTDRPPVENEIRPELSRDSKPFASDTPHQLTAHSTTHEMSELPSTFESDQGFLQRAAAQLEVPDQSAGQSKDRVEALVDLMLLGSYQKALIYGQPVSDRLKQRIDSMNIKTLSKIELKLALTPDRLAARYLVWVHAYLGTNSPNPLEEWLKDLEAEIMSRYKNYPARKIYRAAERELLILVSFYASALLARIEEFCATLPFDAFAAACAQSGYRMNPKLARNLLKRREQLLVWAAVIDIIEHEYLKTAVLPENWRDQLDFSQLRFTVAAGRSRRSALTHQKPREHAVCLEEAHAKVEQLLATAKARANITQTHDLLFALMKARLNLTKRLDDFRQLAQAASKIEARAPRPAPAAPKRKVSARRGRAPRIGT